MRDGLALAYAAIRLAAGALILPVAASRPAGAFPFLDPTNKDAVAAITGGGGPAPNCRPGIPNR